MKIKTDLISKLPAAHLSRQMTSLSCTCHRIVILRLAHCKILIPLHLAHSSTPRQMALIIIQELTTKKHNSNFLSFCVLENFRYFKNTVAIFNVVHIQWKPRVLPVNRNRHCSCSLHPHLFISNDDDLRFQQNGTQGEENTQVCDDTTNATYTHIMTCSNFYKSHRLYYMYVTSRITD